MKDYCRNTRRKVDVKSLPGLLLEVCISLLINVPPGGELFLSEKHHQDFQIISQIIQMISWEMENFHIYRVCVTPNLMLELLSGRLTGKTRRYSGELKWKRQAFLNCLWGISQLDDDKLDWKYLR